MAYDVIGNGYQLNRQVNLDISYETRRGYGINGNVTESRDSPHVFVRYNIRVYTRAGNYFRYPIYISNIEFGGQSYYGGTEIKRNGDSRYDFTYTTPWGGYVDTDGNVWGGQVVISDGAGGYFRTGYYDLKAEPRIIPQPTNYKSDITPLENIDTTILGKITFGWKHWGGDYPSKIQVSRKNDEDYFDVPVTQWITIDVEPRSRI